MPQKPQIILVEDHLLFRQSLKNLLTAESIATVVGEASNGFELIEILSLYSPDMVLMDIDMPLMDGIVATRKALELQPNLKIIAFTMYYEKEFISQMKEIGAKGFISKSCSIQELEKLINDIAANENSGFKIIPDKISNSINSQDAQFVQQHSSSNEKFKS